MSTGNNIRYSRQISVPQIGREGQKKICESKVLIIGSGALGSMVGMQLAGAGVGKIGIADFDTVDISNLHRQFFFNTSEAGKPKAHILNDRMKGLNPEIEVNVYNKLITPEIASEIFSDYDFIVDATDNPESKKMTGEISRRIGKGCCIGGVRDFEGQIITLYPKDYTMEDYFGIPGADGFMPCSLGGVMGPAAALCASIQTAEVIKYIVGLKEKSTGGMVQFDLSTNTFRKFEF